MLDRLIPSDDSHTVITEGKSYSIEVIKANQLTFRVPCKGAHSPAKFIINYNDVSGGNGEGGTASKGH